MVFVGAGFMPAAVKGRNQSFFERQNDRMKLIFDCLFHSQNISKIAATKPGKKGRTRKGYGYEGKAVQGRTHEGYGYEYKAEQGYKNEETRFGTRSRRLHACGSKKQRQNKDVPMKGTATRSRIEPQQAATLREARQYKVPVKGMATKAKMDGGK